MSRGGQNQQVKLFIGSENFGNFKQRIVGLHDARLESTQKLTAGKVMIRKILSQETLQLVVDGLGNAKGMSAVT